MYGSSAESSKESLNTFNLYLQSHRSIDRMSTVLRESLNRESVQRITRDSVVLGLG